MEQEKITVFTI